MIKVNRYSFETPCGKRQHGGFSAMFLEELERRLPDGEWVEIEWDLGGWAVSWAYLVNDKIQATDGLDHYVKGRDGLIDYVKRFNEIEEAEGHVSFERAEALVEEILEEAGL